MAGLMASKPLGRWVAKFCLLPVLATVPTDARTAPIETEHLFGFTIGSDVGEVGERELEGTVTGRFAKRTGTYDAAATTTSVEFMPIKNLRTEFTGAVVAYDVTGVNGLADQRY